MAYRAVTEPKSLWSSALEFSDTSENWQDFHDWYLLMSYVAETAKAHLAINRYFADTFAKNAILLGLLAEDYKIRHYRESAPNGWYGPTIKHFPISKTTWNPNCIELQVLNEALEQGADWGPLKAGLLDGSPDRLEAAIEAYLDTCEWIRGDLERLKVDDSKKSKPKVRKV
ncbi:hypothetical protein [Mycolicibacterium novocastrense]|uniref:hypothetical protein n=1 Tax=Mycolicibacterium novocastrense TaxID=59813 RepID=UPI000A4FDD08|nr:hypothetical protein [Mycolicibacterium novocastrense]